MAGKFIEGHGILGVKALMGAVVTKMLDNGFEKLYPTTSFDVTKDTKIVLKAGETVDPLSATQPWAIKLEWDDPTDTDGMCDVYVATPIQFSTVDGSHATYKIDPSDTTTVEALGILGSAQKEFLGGDATVPTAIDDFPQMLLNRDRISKTFLHRHNVAKTQINSFPLSYNMVISSRGIALMVWDETSDAEGNKNSWFVVQRPVNHSDGTTVTTGKAPVHCIYGISGAYEYKPWLNAEYARTFVGFPMAVLAKALSVDAPSGGGQDPRPDFWKQLLNGSSTYFAVSAGAATIDGAAVPTLPWSGIEQAYRSIPKAVPYCLRRFIVRESDVTAPYPTQNFIKDGIAPASNGGPSYDYTEMGQQFGVPADQHTVDYSAVINSKQQVAISEDNKYIITFPNGMNTARYAYTHEMDLIAYTSADVVSSGTDVAITVYGEATPRTYTALLANGPNNTGMRVLFLKSGGGVTPESV